MRQDDRRVGSRWDNSFCMNQCHYMPAGHARMVWNYAQSWLGIIKDPIGYDTMMRDWMRRQRMKYWIHVPSLVQHRVAKSMIHPRRSSKRQAFTFGDAWE
jgi:hypothetical protein